MMDRRPSLRTIAITLTCLLLPLTLLAGTITTAFYKTTNPDHVDITASLAYLQQTIIVSVLVFLLIVASIVALIVKMYRNSKSFSEAKLPLVLLVLTVIIIGGVLIANSYTNSVQDQYLIDNGRPTLDQFFNALEQQKK